MRDVWSIATWRTGGIGSLAYDLGQEGPQVALSAWAADGCRDSHARLEQLSRNDVLVRVCCALFDE